MNNDRSVTYTSLDQMPDDERELVLQAEEASKNAYAPYSQFYVGAALLLNDGTILHGANQENAAYPSGLCAERVAIFHCMNTYPERSIKKIAVIARKKESDHFVSAAPCGGCRQVMLEQEQRQHDEIEVLFKSKDNWMKVTGISTLLPFSFDKNALI